MSEADTSSVADADLHVRADFDRITRNYLLSVLSDDLIEEHRRKPEGHHSEPLTRLLNWCQTRPLHEQYAVLQETGGRYHVVRLSGKPRVPPAPDRQRKLRQPARGAPCGVSEPHQRLDREVRWLSRKSSVTPTGFR